ncbi:LPXTG cell wall anchor domain-containing protein [Enterococcus rivorum]|uniref:Gram-positive cocci surface proteins LPxTG domain-containing protein n=1 Tax=Enterococcus rivorum TaxID=762845 RepID=A0A1E5KSX5_9ENTE|nr:LPXTG cell wall anchor domain-containing protein [Enterococcus rivorum]MBP2097379.1 LPXTG-motif cell wall-anchored protein [Enterococcus rivorum]OEH80729.1 hypothetical protein BCR26_06915 [Enterococcus rivorum]
MKLKHFLVCFLSISVGVFLFLQPIVSVATEGGQVGQGAGIEFYVDESEPSASSSEEVTFSSIGTKPSSKGKYPNTGEVVKRSLAISGAVLVMIIFLFSVIKSRKEKEE